MDIEVPRALDTLSESERAIVLVGSGNFPKDIVKAVLSSDVNQQQKIHDIVAIVGPWMFASSGARWAVGLIGEEPYAERIGIGIKTPLSIPSHHFWHR